MPRVVVRIKELIWGGCQGLKNKKLIHIKCLEYCLANNLLYRNVNYPCFGQRQCNRNFAYNPLLKLFKRIYPLIY